MDQLTQEQRSAAAAGFATALARQGTLFDLVTHLAALEECGEIAPADVEQELRREIEQALHGAADKVDGLSHVIDQHVAAIGGLDGEIAARTAGELARLTLRRARLQKSLERIRDYCLACIVAMGQGDDGKYRKLSGTVATFQANKVAPSCEVYDVEAVPMEYKEVTITRKLPGAVWKALLLRSTELSMSTPNFTAEWSIDKRALLAALKVACGACAGKGETFPADAGEPQLCAKCNAKGTTLIPGARLLTGKASLKIT